MRYQNYGGGFRGPSGPQMRFPSLSDVKYTKMFLIACLVMYGLQWVGLVIGGPENDFVTGLLSLKPKAVFESFQIWRLFTFAFLHDPRTPLHILFNLLVLYFFCPSLERAWGPKRFLSFMLYSILVPGIIAAFFYFSPSEDVTVIGASGVVFAALTAYAFLWPTRQILLFFIIPVPVLPVILVLLGIEVISMLQDIVYTDKSNVAHIAHVAGAAVGYVAVKKGGLLKNPLWSFFKQRRAEKSRKREIQDEEYADQLFAKIAREGIGSLTDRERRFLDDYSRRKRNGY